MKVRYSVLATALLATVCATSFAQAEGTPKSAPTGQSMQNNSGTKTPDEQDTNKRSMAPNAGQTAPGAARTTGSGTGMNSGMGATNTDSGRATPDEQDTSRGKGPSTAKPPVGSR